MEFGTKITTLTLTFLQPKTGKKELFQFNGNLQVHQHHGAGEGELSILMGVVFSHRPPEGFLQAHGSYLNLKKEANQRREDRIALTAENRALVELTSLNTLVNVEHIERKCLLRELSYNGARVILTGVAPFLVREALNPRHSPGGAAAVENPGEHCPRRSRGRPPGSGGHRPRVPPRPGTRRLPARAPEGVQARSGRPKTCRGGRDSPAPRASNLVHRPADPETPETLTLVRTPNRS